MSKDFAGKIDFLIFLGFGAQNHEKCENRESRKSAKN